MIVVYELTCVWSLDVQYIYSQLYYYNPNLSDDRIYIQFGTICTCYAYLYNLKVTHWLNYLS